MSPIKGHDRIDYIYSKFQADDTEEIKESATETIVALKKKHVRVDLTPVPSGRYKFGYCLEDIYGRKHYLWDKPVTL